MTDHSTYTEYFEQAAMNHKSIKHLQSPFDKHFFGIERFEFDAALKSLQKSPSVLLHPFTIQNEGSLGAPKKRYAGALSIVKKVKKIGDFQQIAQVRAECLQLAKDFESKMINDRRKGEFLGLQIDGFNFQDEGPLNASFYGVYMSFSWITHNSAAAFEETKWDNETAFTI